MPPRKATSRKPKSETPPPVQTGGEAAAQPVPKVAHPAASGHGRIFLMDTMSFIFRAYHAMARQRPMSTRNGLPTAAAYVFVNMLRKLREDFAPQYLAAVFDVAAPTFRDQEAEAVTTIRKFNIKTQSFEEIQYHGYKANRTEMPGDLAQQLPYIRRALEAYRIPMLEYPGYEADDVIGTLARKGVESGYSVYVVSSDKDMLQLVNEHVHVLNPPKDNLIADAAKVEEILGVPPSRVIDVMALRGDSIDNIPGAPGIGDKGSVEIIRRFGSVEQALERAAEVEKKTYRESLQNNREAILFSKRMVTIDCNVPVELDLNAMKTGAPDQAALRSLFTELEFTTLLKELLPVAEVSESHYAEAKSGADLDAYLRTGAVNAIAALAIESGSSAKTPSAEQEVEVEEAAELEPPLAESGLLFGEVTRTVALQEMPSASTASPAAPAAKLALSIAPGTASTFALTDATTSRLAAVLADPARPKAIHDYKGALHTLAPLNLAVTGPVHDPRLYSYLLNPTYSSHTLSEIALRRLNLMLSGNLAEAADITGRVAAALAAEVEQSGLTRLYNEIDLPMVRVLASMEETGVKIDTRTLAAMSARLEREVDAKGREIWEECGIEFNINSPKQLGDVLFNRLNLPKPVKYGKGKTISTAVDVLEGLAEDHAAPRMVLEYRQLSKLKSTYVDALPSLINPATGRLHTTFDLTGTATGRLSSANPNLQNIPIRTELGREIRAAFIAEPGHVLLAADYSQIELRLLAHFSQDPLLVEAFRRGDDIHTLTASQVFGVPPLMVTADHRRQAKVVNFGIVYGLSAFGLAQNLGIEQREARQFIDNYFEKYAGVRAFIDRTLADARQNQKVATLFGRVRPIPDINSKNPNLRGFAERTAVNTPLQGTAADLIKIAMLRIDEALRDRQLRSRMTLQVHDELVFEVPEAELDIMRSLVKEVMENVHPLEVPLLVEIGVGPNWRDLD